MRKDYIDSPHHLATMDMVKRGISARAAYLKEAMEKEKNLHLKEKLKEEFSNELVVCFHKETQLLLLTMSKQELSLLSFDSHA